MSRNHQIRVLLVSFYYNRNIYSGANKRFDETGKYLKRQRCDLTVVVLQGHVPTWCEENEVVTFRTRLPGFLKRFKLFVNFQSWLKKQLPSLIISDFMPVPAKALKKHRHFQLVHDLRNFTTFHRARFPQISRLWQARQWKKSQNIITVSSYTKEQLGKYCKIPADRVTVAFNGIEQSYLEHDLNSNRSIDFLYIAHFEDRKNHARLVKALIELNKRGVNAKTVFVGKDHGTLETVQTLITEHDLSENILIYTDNFTEHDLINLYLSSKVFVSPALYEGFGMPIIEAFACGCVVCCSDMDVFHEVGGEYAFYFDPYDEMDIANVLLNGRDHKTDRHKLRSVVENRFVWDRTLSPLDEDMLTPIVQ